MGKYIEPLQTFINKLAESYRSGELQPKQPMRFIAVQQMLKIISNPDFLPKAGISHDQAMKSLQRCEEWLKKIPPEIYEFHGQKLTVFKPSQESLGIIVTSSPGCSQAQGLTIAQINPGSVIARDGRFHTGDRIVRINDHALVDLTISQVREILANSGNQVKLEIVSNSSQRFRHSNVSSPPMLLFTVPKGELPSSPSLVTESKLALDEAQNPSTTPKPDVINGVEPPAFPISKRFRLFKGFPKESSEHKHGCLEWQDPDYGVTQSIQYTAFASKKVGASDIRICDWPEKLELNPMWTELVNPSLTVPEPHLEDSKLVLFTFRDMRSEKTTTATYTLGIDQPDRGHSKRMENCKKLSDLTYMIEKGHGFGYVKYTAHGAKKTLLIFRGGSYFPVRKCTLLGFVFSDHTAFIDALDIVASRQLINTQHQKPLNIQMLTSFLKKKATELVSAYGLISEDLSHQKST